MEDEVAIQNFRKFIQFRTISGEGFKNGSNNEAVGFLSKICESMGLEVHILPGPDPQPKPILVAKWPGTSPELPSLLLNSHYDVVPVVEEAWTVDAFAAEDRVVDGERRIYGRGTQDMKCVCVQYVEALKRLKAKGFQPKRTIWLSFVPDEEIGGGGMSYLIQDKIFQTMNIGCVLDEGLANPAAGEYTVFYGERTTWWLMVEAKGPTGHGSRPISGIATHGLTGFMNRALKYRAAQIAELGHTGGCAHASCKKLGDIATMNLTMMKAGVSPDGGETFVLNVVPTEASAGFDVRIPVQIPHAEMSAMFDRWSREAEQEWEMPEGSITWKLLLNPMKEHFVTDTSSDNPWWSAFIASIENNFPVRVRSEIFPAGTDARFLRKLGLPCFGFSPIRGQPVLLHEHDEYLSTNVFLEGISVYEKVLQSLTELEIPISKRPRI